MSPFGKSVILDNDVISRLHRAGALRRALEVWPKSSFCVTDEVVDEARRWPAKGKELVVILKDLEAKRIIRFISVDQSSEEEIQAYTWLRLQNRLGRGESASIAIAFHREFYIATDDGIAREVCRTTYPSVSIFGTGNLLNMAIRDGLMTQREVDSIRARIRRSDST